MLKKSPQDDAMTIAGEHDATLKGLPITESIDADW
jgi:hypothetical protein